MILLNHSPQKSEDLPIVIAYLGDGLRNLEAAGKYLTGSFLTHSNLLSSRHVNHHKKFKCNFSFLFPIFDYACGTLYVIVQ